MTPTRLRQQQLRARRNRLGTCTECSRPPRFGSRKCVQCIRKNINASVRYRKTLRGRYSHFKVVSKRRGINVCIDFVEFTQLATSRCHYCNAEPTIKYGYGIDRQNHRKAYVSTNVVPCCRKCNMKKGILERLGFVYPRTCELLRELLHG